MRVRVGIDALPALPGKSGAVGAIRNMISIVPKIDSEIGLYIFVNPIQYNYYKSLISEEDSGRIKLLTIKIPSHLLALRIWAQNVVIPRLCHQLNINVHYSMNPEPAFKMSGVKEVFKIADLQYYDVPEEFGITKAIYRYFMGKQKVKRARILIANSEYTKGKIKECFKIGDNRIRVVHEAFDHRFFNSTRPDPGEMESFRERYGITYPYVIYISSFRPYKNHVLLLNAFRLAKNRGLPHHLVLIGNNIRRYRKQVELEVLKLGLLEFVHFYDYVHHWDLKYFYKAANLAVYPSELETFGIPPLEAMACGLPVIVSNRTAVPEISGGGADIVDPHDTPLMADAIYNVLTNDTLNRELRERGWKWSKQFTWEKNIKSTLSIINEIAT